MFNLDSKNNLSLIFNKINNIRFFLKENNLELLEKECQLLFDLIKAKVAARKINRDELKYLYEIIGDLSRKVAIKKETFSSVNQSIKSSYLDIKHLIYYYNE